MGLDITIVEYIGKDEKGYLKTKSPDKELPYTTDRLSIRKEISKNIKLKVLNSGKYYDPEEYYRPDDFEEAYKWSSTLNEKEKKYIDDLLKSLEMDNNYYLSYNY